MNENERKIISEYFLRQVIEEVAVPEFETRQEAIDFMASLDPEDVVDSEVIDPETGEVLLDVGESLNDIKVRGEARQAERDARLNYDEEDDWLITSRGWQMLSEYENIYNVDNESFEELIEEPAEMSQRDYDIYRDVPVKAVRKDNEPFDETDVLNAELFAQELQKTILPQNIKVWANVTEGDMEATFSYGLM